MENYSKILRMLLPILPHISSECLEDIDFKEELNWPPVNQKYLTKDNSKIVIQINGKKRSLIEVIIDENEKNILNIIKNDEKLNKFLKNKIIVKTIYIKNKLLNIITK